MNTENQVKYFAYDAKPSESIVNKRNLTMDYFGCNFAFLTAPFQGHLWLGLIPGIVVSPRFFLLNLSKLEK